jgi:hypothetical protein
MKVNTNLCVGIANQQEYDDTVILSQGSRVRQHASPRCVDCTLDGSRVNWQHAKPFTRVPQEPTRSEGSSITRSTRVALRGSRRVSTISLTITSSEHRTIFHACFDGDHHQAV